MKKALLTTLYTPLFMVQGQIPVAIERGEVYDPVWVTRGLNRKYIWSSPIASQSAIDIHRPWRMCAFSYRSVVRVLKSLPPGRRFLMIGVGGGSFFHAVKYYWPDAELVGIEKDLGMVNTARKHFGLPDDARIIVEEAETIILELRGEEKFDFIFVDVYDGLYPPDIFMQEQTIRAISECLNLDGALCMNTVRRHAWDKKHRELRSAFASTFKHTGEAVSGEGRTLPVLPHNVVLVGTNATGVVRRPFSEIPKGVRDHA
jgi:precorrin-6B methylase 2